MTTGSYAAAGLTCGYCMAEVLENVHPLSGVTDVAVDLVTGGQPPLFAMSGTTLGVDAVRDADENAGFGLLPPRGREVRQRGDSPSTQDGDTHPGRERVTSPLGGVS